MVTETGKPLRVTKAIRKASMSNPTVTPVPNAIRPGFSSKRRRSRPAIPRYRENAPPEMKPIPARVGARNIAAPK
jgi:hypothetical protein